jgi:hypothetical protein
MSFSRIYSVFYETTRDCELYWLLRALEINENFRTQMRSSHVAFLYLIKMFFVLTNATCNLRGNRPQMYTLLLSPCSVSCYALLLHNVEWRNFQNFVGNVPYITVYLTNDKGNSEQHFKQISIWRPESLGLQMGVYKWTQRKAFRLFNLYS